MVIQIVDNANYQPTPVHKFIVLGQLFQYAGRSLANSDDFVERFFPHEAHLVDDFCDSLSAWGSQDGAVISPIVTTGDQGHVTIRCKQAAALIASTYVDPDDGGAPPHWGYQSEAMFPAFRRGSFAADVVDDRFSFLLGCHRRFGNDNSFEFANSGDTCDLTALLLEQLECSWIQKESWTKSIPRMTRLRFSPTKPLAQLLQIDADPDGPRPNFGR